MAMPFNKSKDDLWICVPVLTDTHTQTWLWSTEIHFHVEDIIRTFTSHTLTRTHTHTHTGPTLCVRVLCKLKLVEWFCAGSDRCHLLLHSSKPDQLWARQLCCSLNTLLTPDPPHRVPAAFSPLHEWKCNYSTYVNDPVPWFESIRCSTLSTGAVRIN